MQIVRQTPKEEYRKIDALNQSMLKVFDENPSTFYKLFILKEPREETTSQAMLIGDLVDFYLLECRGNEAEFDFKFEDKFTVFQGTRTSAQVFDLADEIFKLTKSSITEEGEISSTFESRFEEALKNIQAAGKYKGKTPAKALEDFVNNGQSYFETLINSIGKKVVDLFVVEKAKYLVNQLLTDDFTKDIFNGNDDREYLTKFAIEFNYKGVNCKMEADAIDIDHEIKQIQPYDLKCTYDNEEFNYSYLKNGYYLQQAFYHKGIKVWAAKNNMSDYSILPMKFIVADTSKNNRRPLVYKLNWVHTDQGLYGFTNNGRHYRGIDQLMGAFIWAQENDIWNISKENFDNNGIVELQEFK